MGGPIRDLIANVRENIRERRAERQGYGNCHSTQSHFEGCRTQVEGCQPNNFRAKIAGGVPAQSVPAQSMGGARAMVCENGFCTPADIAPSTTASSTTATTQSAATKNYPDTKGEVGVKLGEGVYARIAGGKILATIDVSSAPSNGKFDYSFKEGTRSSSGSFDLDIVRAGSSGVIFDKTGANKLNARAESTVDEIKLKIPDGKGGTREINISKASILKAEAAAEKQAKEASEKARAGSSTVPPTKPEPEVARKAVEEAKKRDDTPVETSNQGAASTTSTTTDKQGLAADAAVVKRMLETNLGSLGWNSPVHNDIANPDMYAGLDLLLARHSNQTARAQLIDTIDPAVLGELVHELPEADKESVMAKLLAPLGDGKINTLTSAVDTLAAEYGKSGNPFKSAFDTAKINEAFGGIASLGEGAESFAKLLWYKEGNDAAFLYPNNYDKMKKALGDAVASQPNPEKSKESPLSGPKVTAAEVEKFVKENPAPSANPDKMELLAAKLKTDLQLNSARTGRSSNPDSFYNIPGALQILADKSPTEKVVLLETAVGIDNLTSSLKKIAYRDQKEIVSGILGADLMKKLDTFNSELSSGPFWSDKAALQAIDALPADEKKLLSMGWDINYRGQALFGRKSLGFQETVDDELGEYKVKPQ